MYKLVNKLGRRLAGRESPRPEDDEVSPVAQAVSKQDEVPLIDQNPLLLESAENGEQKGVLDALNNGADINTCNYPGGKTALHLAVEKGHVAIVNLLVDKKVDINSADKDSFTPLHYAVKASHEEIVTLLLDKGCVVTHSDKLGQTALHFAVQIGHLSITESLLSKGAEPNRKDLYGKDALYCAVEHGHVAIVKLLLEGEGWRVDVNSEDNLRRRPLHLAIKNCHHDVLQVLLDHNARLDCKDKDGKTPLHYAEIKIVRSSSHSFPPSSPPSPSLPFDPLPAQLHVDPPSPRVIVELLIDCGADPNIQDKYGKTVLHYAARKLNEDIVDILLSNKSDPNIKDKEGNTALHLAVFMPPPSTSKETVEETITTKRQRVVKLLLNKKADTNTRNEMGHTVLQYAVTSNKKKLLMLLVDGGSDVNKRMRRASDLMTGSMAEVQDDETALHFAVRKDFRFIVTLLVNRGAHPNLTDKDGRTALHYAICEQQYSIAEFLLDNGADKSISIADTVNGMTPLHYAAANGCQGLVLQKMLKLLIVQKRANIDMESICKEGKTALQYAVEKNYTETCQLLLLKGAKINHRSNEGRTALMYAAAKGNLASLETLMKNGASLFDEDNEGKTILHIAVENNQLDFVKELLSSHKMHGSYYDKSGKTPLHYAAEKGNEIMLYELIEGRMNPDDINRISGKKALHYAAENGYCKAFLTLLLLDHHGDYEDKQGHTAFYYAAKGGYHDIIDKLMWYATRTRRIEKDVPISTIPFGMPTHPSIRGYVRWNDVIEVELFELLYYENLKALVSSLVKWLPLHYAVETDNFETVAALLIKGERVDRSMEGGWIPLHFASRRGSLDVVKLLLKHESSLEYINKKVSTSQMTAIHFAAKHGHNDVVTFLLQHGADIVLNDKDENGLTPLQYLAESNSWDFLATLVSDHHKHDKYSSTAILYSAKSGEKDIVRHLVQMGADSNSRDKVSQKTALHFAAENDHHSIVEFLLHTAGADPNIKDKAGRTPLNSSYLAGSDRSMQLIQSAGGKFNFNHLLLAAAIRCDIEVLKKSLENGADINFPVIAEETDDAVLRDRKTALHYAVINGHYGIVELLLSEEINIDCQDKGDFTPVHYAVINGHSDILQKLIEKGANLNFKTELMEKAALHFAAEDKNLEIFNILISSESIIIDVEDVYLKATFRSLLFSTKRQAE